MGDPDVWRDMHLLQITQKIAPGESAGILVGFAFSCSFRIDVFRYSSLVW